MLLLPTTPFKASPLAEAPSCAADQRIDVAARHRDLVVRARNVNTREAQLRVLTDHYLSAQELGLTAENGFEVTLRADESGYMFLVRDTADPCNSSVFSNERGVNIGRSTDSVRWSAR